MIGRIALLLLALPYLALLGCSDGNNGAPPDNAAHPLDWIKAHPASALAVADFADCVACHGQDLQGSSEVVSCYSCHAFNTTPPFIVHPADWTDPYTDHPLYAAINGYTTCAKCHGSDLHGSPAAPSCFSTSFDGRNCHPGGPLPVLHPLDGTFLDPSKHGPAAKGLTEAFPNGIADCQTCHGQPGGPGSNPRFNIGIYSVNGTGCEGCHGINLAHPADWAGPNTTFHYSVNRNIIQKSCTLCHGIDLNGAGGVGVSCLDCHAETTSFTLDCTACHGYPPDGSADRATAEAPDGNGQGVPHGGVADVQLHDTCVVCHGMKQSATGGSFSAAPNYKLFDKATNTYGDHWNGKIDMNSSVGYDQTNFGCIGACHVNDATHQLSGSGLPVELQGFGFDEAVPHPVDISFLYPENHGPAAKGLTAAFPDGMLNCWPCHAQGTINPRFNVGISLNGAGGNGCEQCHNDGTAHPSKGGRDNYRWYDNQFSHDNVPASKFTTMCTLCHGANLEGGSGPGCFVCHYADPVEYPTGCVSCHNRPPDGLPPVGNMHPNLAGQHGLAGHSSYINDDPAQTCGRCHKDAGVGTAAHVQSRLRPADVNFDHPDPTDTISAESTTTNTTCNGACHISNGTLDFLQQHNNATWYAPAP